VGEVQSVCVYCSSSNKLSNIYKKAAIDLGTILGRNNIRLVYGGGKRGLMGILADASIKAGGQVTGFMTQFLYDYEGGNQKITDLHIVGSMHERKQCMFAASDAFIILPGGLGTLDETFEIMTWKQLGLHKKQIIIIDINGYWRPLFDNFFSHMVKNHSIRKEDRNLFIMISSVDNLLEILRAPVPYMQNFVEKWG
jgi:uncharacterized protein (TIGR00730 family)